MSFQVETVSDRKTLNDFLSLPFSIYRDDPNWIAPMTREVKRVLDPVKNPYFSNASLKLFNCYQDDKICSRVAITVNHQHALKFGIRGAFFGFFESIDNQQAVEILFDKVERFCKDNNIEGIEGPLNPNHYSELGLQLSHFNEPPAFFQTYNPEYYSHLLEQNGFALSKVIHTRKNSNIGQFVNKHFGENISLEANGYRVRPLRFDYLREDLNHLREIYNDAFSENWHFLPLSDKEYNFSAKYLGLVSTPASIQFVEFNNQPIGVVQFVLDINPLLKPFKGKINFLKYLKFKRQKKNIRHLIVFAIGVKKEYRNTRAFPLLLNATVKISKSYQSLETTWTSDDNIAAIKASERLGMIRDKEFGIYEKRIV